MSNKYIIVQIENLIADLKVQIASRLKIKNVTPEDIGDTQPLFGEGLGLDSLDALELMALLRQKYRLKITNADDGRTIFTSVKTIAEYIISKQAEAK